MGGAGYLMGGQIAASIGQGLVNWDMGKRGLAAARQESAFARNFAARMYANQTSYNTSERIAAQKFNERMSSTAIQRGVKDAEAAGLHRSFASGGASSPSVSGASASQATSGQPSLPVPQLQLPDIFRMGMSIRQLEQMDRQLDIADAKSIAEIGKITKDKELIDKKMKSMGWSEGFGAAGSASGEFMRWFIKKLKSLATKPLDQERFNQGMESQQNMTPIQQND